MDNFDLRKYLAEGKLFEEEVDVLSNEFLQDIQDTMKMYYKMNVDMDDIKDWVNMYYIGYNSEYDEGPGDVDYEGNEFGSEDYESEKKELVFDTAEREDFYMHLNPDAESTFPNLQESKTMNNFDLRKYLAEGKLYEKAYNLPDSDSNTDKYVNNHWDSILKDILRAHTDLRNSKGGEGMPERPSQLDIDIVLGRFDGADEFMDVDPSVYDGDYFDFYDMYLVTQRDEENTKDISVEDYPEGDYSGYTKRDDLPNLAEGKLLKEEKGINYLKDAFETYLAGGDTFTNKPGKTETVKFKNDGSLIPKNKFEVALQSLPTTVKVDVYNVNFKKVGDNIVGTFKIK